MIWVDIDRHSRMSLTDQIFNQIRHKILNGELAADEKLPSTRLLADEIDVSRNIIINVYEQLIAEGYVYTVKGAGTFISKDLVWLQHDIVRPDFTKKIPKKIKRVIDLTGGIPDLNLFPVKKWKECYSYICNMADTQIFNYPDPGGDYCLKYEICKYLLRNRGIYARPENIFITNGSMHNFSIISSILDNTKKIIIENPVFYSIRDSFISHNKKLIPVDVDSNGLIANEILENNFDFIFTTPSHQYPLAVTLSAERRIKLIHIAAKADSYILEDDYDSEFRYKGNRISSLYSLSPQRVIYSGTFSKTLSPSIRLGYMIVPDLLLEKCSSLFNNRKILINKLEQLTLAEFIHKGYLEKHLSAKKKKYARRLNFLKNCIKELFNSEVNLLTNNSGLHLVAEFRNHWFTRHDLNRLEEKNIIVETVNMHSVPKKPYNKDNRIIIAFSNIQEKEIQYALNIIKKHIKNR